MIEKVNGASKPKEEVNESESSENIKDRFDRMKDEAYDINKDLVMIQENEEEDNDDLSVRHTKASRVLEEEKDETVI